MLALALAMPPAPRPFLVAYVPNWIDLAAFAETIDYAKVTHLNVAFENPVDADGTLSYNPVNDALIRNAHAKGVKVLVSLGGGAASGDKALNARYFDLISESRRKAFSRILAAYVRAHGFDGLDLDLEGPSINADYGAFVEELRRAMREKLLTAALSQGYGGDKVSTETLRRFDFVNVMAYDGTGYWNPDVPGPHSTLEFAKSNLEYWLGRGLPKAKTVLGVPFYGYGFGAAFRGRDYPYREIVTLFPGAENGDQVGSTVWYNGLATMRAKGALVRERGLAGAMVWSLDLDAPGDKSLLAALDGALRTPTTGR